MSTIYCTSRFYRLNKKNARTHKPRTSAAPSAIHGRSELSTKTMLVEAIICPALHVPPIIALPIPNATRAEIAKNRRRVPKAKKKCCENYDQDSHKQVMQQVAAGIDMLHAHQ